MTKRKILTRITELEDRILARLDEGKKITQTQVNAASDLNYDYQDYSAELLDEDEAAYNEAVNLLEERIDSLVQGIDLLYDGDATGKDYILENKEAEARKAGKGKLPENPFGGIVVKSTPVKIPDIPAWVALNDSYTATVYDLNALRDYIRDNPDQIDPQYLEVRRGFQNTMRSNALYQLVRETRNELIRSKGFEAFNDYPTTCIDLTPNAPNQNHAMSGHTISVKYGDERITFAFVPQATRSDHKDFGKLECVDICRWTAPNNRMKSIMFDGGTKRTDAEGTLLCLNTRDVEVTV